MSGLVVILGSYRFEQRASLEATVPTTAKTVEPQRIDRSFALQVVLSPEK